ncbi:hypothetical protein KSF_070440 [Reticulibacter mediterranei]|uniref:Uncharacterized protein n=2 Tax=Reticulibacter mediterranei TaxID=2778369 RepID=A0A8J3IXB2_9CHLR|nr:hypothetical protein KSF_070440 [Reticulibacter mediterranei]
MPDHRQSDGTWINEENELEAGNGQTDPLALATRQQETDEIEEVDPKDQELVKSAKWSTIDDLEEIKKLHRREKFVIIDWQGVEEKAHDQALKEIKKNYSQNDPPENQEIERLLSVYARAYKTRLKEGLKTIPNNIDYFNNPQEARLRELAIRDRREFPTHDHDHIRDMAVVRVLQELHISLHIATDHFSAIHDLAAKYQHYYSDSREAVVWPGQGFF